ncbi:DUF4153 domain-containing protein [Nitratireductor basaltis]|uniref:DUF4153 domain-containing protein n=1 Tax=Nitratireductor basaltis TaxID=472175 RepID=A0A084UAA8_9HYPH|nr:DUF4153 domain-containing protein [Nitratireductor basaltis]KFB09894.1 hypothetical protein EL18_00916 [Nitratireductor basaltis]
MTIWAEEIASTGWKSVLREMQDGIGKALSRFPVPIAFLSMATISAFMEIADASFALPWRGPNELMAAFLGAAAAALVCTLVTEAHQIKRSFGYLSGLLFGLLLGALLLDPAYLWVQEWSLVAALAGLILVAPFTLRGNSSQFWMFSLRVAFSVMLMVLALLLFAGGTSATLATLSFLFGFDIDQGVYQYVWAFTGLLAAPVFGLGQLPRNFDHEPRLSQIGAMDRGMRALGDFVAAPLLILYAAILHLYAAKIVLTGELPAGQIGWLVLTYGFCLFGTLLVINPFLDLARAPTRFVLRFWPAFLVVPLILLALALWVRVAAFGFTPDRYMVMLFGGVSATVVALQLVPTLRGDIRLILALPVAALFLASFGPQGARAVSVASQEDRFRNAIANEQLTQEQELQALASLRYLSGQGALQRVTPVAAEGEVLPDGYEQVARAYGLDPELRYPERERLVLRRSETLLAEDLGEYLGSEGYGFDIFLPQLSLRQDYPVDVALPSGKNIRVSLAEDSILLETENNSARFHVAEQDVAALEDRDSRVLRLIGEDEEREMLVIPAFAFVSADGRLQTFETLVFLRGQDWD